MATPAGVIALATADDRAAATAEVERAAAQATLNSANATLSAAQTQDQNNSNLLAAQIAAAAEIAQANAQATLNSASSTQNAALAQDAIRQTQTQFNSQMTAEQQTNNENAASTQSAVANSIATQTRSAAATSQWYADQSRQRDEQIQGPIAFLWTWCLPIFIVLFAGLGLWGFWRWLKLQQDRQRSSEQPAGKLQAPAEPGRPRGRFPPPGNESANGRRRPTKPDEQIRGWLDEIKRKLLDREKDNDDHTDN
jgi:hypothetical protein